MRITKLEIKDFGKFTDSKVIDDINPKIALFYGENEAGKTTIFNLIKTVIYGFYPASSESHPYSSWKNGRIEYTAEIENANNQRVLVKRKLLSRPQGKYMLGETYENLRNDTLPNAKHVSMDIYEKIYSLRVEDLEKIEGEAWEEVEDKLLANYGRDLVKNTREVLKDIKNEYDQIWRENNRGKFLAKELDSRIREIKRKKRDAKEREEEIRKLDNRIREINNEADKLKDNKIALKALLKKAKELMPVKSILDTITELNERIIHEDISSSLPNNIREKLGMLEKKIQELNADIKSKKSLLQEKSNEMKDISLMDRLIIDNKTKVHLFYKNHSRIENIKENINKVKNSIEKIKDRLIHESNNFLTDRWHNNIREEFEKINKSELQILVSRYRNTEKELNEAILKKELESSAKIEIKFPKAYIIGFIFGLIILTSGIFLETSILMIVGLVGVIYGATGILNYFNMKKSYQKHFYKNNKLNKLNNIIDELKLRIEEDRKKLKGYLDGIPVSDLAIESLDEMFIPNIMKIKDIVYDLGEFEKELKTLNLDYAEEGKELEKFLSEFSFDTPLTNEEKLFYLKERLESVEKNILLNEGLNKEISIISREIDILEDKYKNEDNELQIYLKKLSDIGSGSIEQGLKITDENLKIRNRIDSLEEELNNRSNIESLIESIKKYDDEETWIFSDYEIAKAEENLESINQRLTDLGKEKTGLEFEMNNLLEKPTLDEIESDLMILEEDLERAYKKRDRLALLSEVIKFADQRFKEKNQPDVLKNASKYFSIITNGKYTDIFLDEFEEGSSLMVKQKGELIPRKVLDTFSKGTLNQLYLSLRLSLIDHLDKENEALPISFDELLVNWDSIRLENSLKLLKQISENRQIFIFTCHDWMAKKVEGYFNTDRIKLTSKV